MVSNGNIDILDWTIILMMPVCIMSIATIGATLGWGLEILRRRQVTLLILFGMCVAGGYLVLLVLRFLIQPQLAAVNRMRIVPTVQATAVPIPTEQLPRGSRE